MALAILRAMVLVAVFSWYLFAPASVDRRDVGLLIFGFLCYSLGIYALLWFQTWRTIRLNVLVMLLDVAFALAMVRLTGGAQSVFFLAFYLIVALQSYYYGLGRGVGVAVAAMAAYLVVVWPTLVPAIWADYAIRAAVLMLTAVGLGVLAEVEGRERLEIAGLNRELAAREQRIRNVFDSLRDGVVVLDGEQRVVGWNRAMADRYNVAEDEVLGRPFFEVFPNLAREGLEAALASLHGGHREEFRLERFEHETLRRGRVTLNVKGSALRSSRGDLEGVVLVVEDITERLALEQSIQRAEKLAALGTLSAGLTHEVNNPIGIITSRIELMLMEAEEQNISEGFRSDLQVLHRNAQRVAKIAQGLLSFSRVSTGEKRPVHVNQVVEETLLLLEKQLVKEGIALTRRLSEGLPPILGDENALQQVLMNLLTNAREAMTGGGEIAIETGPESHRPGWIRLSVKDQGSGIPAHILPKVFDPFFTTKPNGTGLGLAVSYGIVQEHHGTINVHSLPGRGTTFVLTFPALADGARS
jgi:PAS domain S-box-containing protein